MILAKKTRVLENQVETAIDFEITFAIGDPG
jgi:hypothetical protein